MKKYFGSTDGLGNYDVFIVDYPSMITYNHQTAEEVQKTASAMSSIMKKYFKPHLVERERKLKKIINEL